jgi:hypothetical protein
LQDELRKAIMAQIIDQNQEYMFPPEGLSISNPKKYFSTEEKRSLSFTHLNNNDLRSAVIEAFDLPRNDSYVYHAIASVTLSQVQEAINAGTSHGLCNWYLDSENKLVCLSQFSKSNIKLTISAWPST